MQKTSLGHLAPSDGQAQQHMKGLKVDQAVSVTIVRPRNIKFHRLFFKALDIVWKNGGDEKYDNFNAFRDEILMRAGHYREHVHLSGKISYQAKSISFAKMGELEFNEIYYKCLDVMIEHFMPGMEREKLDKEIRERVGGFY